MGISRKKLQASPISKGENEKPGQRLKAEKEGSEGKEQGISTSPVLEIKKKTSRGGSGLPRKQ